MAVEMSEEELASELEAVKGQAGQDIGYTNDDDSDDYVTATLYAAADGRSWRYVESTGFNTGYSGAGEFGEWLEERDDPADFGQA